MSVGIVTKHSQNSKVSKINSTKRFLKTWLVFRLKNRHFFNTFQTFFRGESDEAVSLSKVVVDVVNSAKRFHQPSLCFSVIDSGKVALSAVPSAGRTPTGKES
jgi:hypothetical protein